MRRPGAVVCGVTIALALAGVARPTLAAVSKPFPGTTLVRRPGEGAMVVVDLCAPGVSVRATRYAERKQTPGAWATSLGLEYGQNADFFDYPGWTYVVGRARGAGEDWPANAQQKENRPYWQFGPAHVSGVGNGAEPPRAGVTEIVGGHNVIIAGGQTTGPWAPANDGQLLNTLHERSAVGISADGRTLYLLSTVQEVSATTLVGMLQSMASEAGAPPIDFATNQDGGGSSQLYVKGLGQIVDSGRLVNNHLGIAAKGAGASPQCNNLQPIGYLDSADCEAVIGWAQDPNAPDAAIGTHIYYNGVAGDPNATGVSIKANVHREDLCMAIGSCAHGFSTPPPISLLDGLPHEVHAYGIDSEGGANRELADSPRTLMCTPVIEGVRRHVQNPAILAAWKFETFFDMLLIEDTLLESLVEATVLPETPVMVRSDDGSPEVWLVDGVMGEYRRHVSNPQVAAAWRLDLATVTTVPASEVEALIEGPPLRARPFLLKGTGPAVYVLDDPLPVPGGGTTGGSEGTSGEPEGSTSPGASSETPTTGGTTTTPTGTAGETGGGSGSGEESTGPAVEDGDGGCGCDARGGPASAWMVLLLGLRRRSRAHGQKAR